MVTNTILLSRLRAYVILCLMILVTSTLTSAALVDIDTIQESRAYRGVSGDITLFQNTPGITIDAPETVHTGETLTISYTIKSTTAQSLVYTIGMYCPNNPNYQPDLRQINLPPNIPLTYQVKYTIGPEYQSGECSIVVHTYAPQELSITKNIVITAMPKLEGEVYICTNECTTQEGGDEAISVQDKINLHINGLNDAQNTVTLRSPQGIETLLIPPYAFVAVEQGTYTITVLATKEGYLPFSTTQKIAVVTAPLQIVPDVNVMTKQQALLQKIMIIEALRAGKSGSDDKRSGTGLE